MGYHNSFNAVQYVFPLGIIGEYIGKIYLETKARPKFIIETNLEETDKE